TNTKDLTESLQALGYNVDKGNLGSASLKILNPAGLAGSTEFKEGLFTIQQEASQKAVEVLDPKENTKILDLCAAPG
ncbi:hypothetical protein O4H66_28545, partial [Comamonadaceae bacterium G21597-S1]|nr:hypothetical protein [Comamonadaceae bacterium G21597-S1]